MRRTLSAVSLAWVACTAPIEGESPELVRPHVVDPVLDGLERLEGDGPFVSGHTEAFHARVETGVEVRWSTSGGELVTDGHTAFWTLPDALRATLSVQTVDLDGVVEDFDFDFELIAVPGGAVGEVDTSGDSNGSHCALVIGASDVPHVIYRNDWHDQWWYAKYQGGSWQNELIDGPGFGVGGVAAYTEPDIELDSNAVPHVVFMRTSGETVYGHRTGGSWQVEVVTTDGLQGFPVQLEIDAGFSDAVLIGDTAPNNERPRISWKTSAWQSSTWTAPSGFSTYAGLRGLALVGTGELRISLDDDEVHTGTWSIGGGFSDEQVISTGWSNLYTRVDIISAPGVDGLLHEGGLWWSTDGGTNWSDNLVLEEALLNKSLVFDGTDPRMGVFHSSNLEFVRPDARGYWNYSTVDTGVSTNTLSVDVDSSGNLHGCYQKSSSLHFF